MECLQLKEIVDRNRRQCRISGGWVTEIFGDIWIIWRRKVFGTGQRTWNRFWDNYARDIDVETIQVLS